MAVDKCTNHAQMHDEMDIDKKTDVQDHDRILETLLWFLNES